MTIETGGRYKITNAKGGTALDLSRKNGRSIAGWGWHATDNQVWELNQVDGGAWVFKNVESGKYLAPDQGNPRDGLPLVGSDQPFGWHIWPDEQDQSTYRICLPNTVFNVDLTNRGDGSGGTPIELWGRWEGKNQCWRFERV